MEMESSRRSIDRAREPGVKKPRLAGDAEFDRDRIFSQRASVGSAVPVVSRFRATDKERDDSIRGAGHSLQQPEEQEIVAQYKTALAELTFNSKPIITNLTIIAGENTQAAKGIAATICTNILEVPSEQKLPSLYLLDSIVKNIGRDYIRHFSGKLPEVFCKAYKQVDSSVHASMRHLFGTWKGVFPQATLQTIEKELGFSPAINGSSLGAVTSRPDSQLQQPPHSIHVNPKYLEARQRLQQVRAKGVSNETTGSTVMMAEDAERPDSSAVVGSSRPWASLPVKAMNTQRSQRDHPNEATHKKNPDAVYGGDYEYGSDISQHSDLGIGKGCERIAVREAVDKASWYGAASNSTNKSALGQRNGFDAPNIYRNSRDPRAQANNQRQTKFIANRSNKGTSENWKNSEEEEFMWEDMNSRLIDEGGTESSRKDCWNTEEAEKPLKNMTRGKWMPLETELLDTSRWNSHDISRLEKPSGSEERVSLKMEIEDRFNQPHGIQSNMSSSGTESYTDTLAGGQAAFGHQTPRLWSSQDMQLSDGLKYKSVASIVSGSVPSSASRSSGTSGHLQHPLRPPSPSESSSFYQQPHSPSSASLMDQDFSQPPSLSKSGQRTQLVGLKRDPRIQARHESLSVASQSQALPVQTMKLTSSQPLQHLQSSTHLPLFAHQSHHLPVSQQPLVEPSNQAQNLLSKPLAIGSSLAVDFSGSGDLNQSAVKFLKESSTSSLLAAIMKSGLVGSNLVTSDSPNPSHPESSHVKIQPLPSGPPPVQQTGSSTTLVGTTSLGNVPSVTTHTSEKVQPPLPPGSPPSTSITGLTSPTSNSSDAVPNPLSNLLSSLVAKGLISTSATELVNQCEPQLPPKPQKQTTVLGGSSSVPVSLSVTSSTDEESCPAPAATGIASCSNLTAVEVKHPIGTEFRSEVIREMHPNVINSLFDDLPHQCNICGLRLVVQEELSRHLDWHASKKQELISVSEVSRKWFATVGDWVSGNMGLPLGPTITLNEETASEVEMCEPMVPADESQCICALCGEPFEDWYSDERDEWMFIGTVYLPTVAGEGVVENAEKVGIIVHADCISRSTGIELDAKA
ncbi:polyadenylation and cleavage factor homolog 4-like [Aristolochia californica]|uniref:polyadenylation and cleavage factor homolog 4-like n=1 Tax=Aristolochia californica TaxID=171875 RepID=UPI0035DDB5BC